MFLAERTVWAYRYRRGSSALVVSMPHVGTFVPRGVGKQLTEAAARRDDTDWHLPRLYDFLGELGATVIVATLSRYVVDVNRPPDGSNLYPGRDTPLLCPVATFHGEPLYPPKMGSGYFSSKSNLTPFSFPGAAEIDARLKNVWHPYHRRLAAEIERVRSEFGAVMLWDAHSIVSEAPRLFEGRLKDFNLGTADGKSCDAGLAEALRVALSRHSSHSSVLNGRFKGGFITRHYGNPAKGVHAVQMEMAESTYMDEASPYTFRNDLAAGVRPILREQLEIALDWVNRRGGARV
jgi:N-formylglutamate deformylase